MNVLVVSKTRMSPAFACVGGLVQATGRYIRLLRPGNLNQPSDTDYEVGQIWDLQFIDRNPLNQPHIEDVIVTARISFVGTINDMRGYILENNHQDWIGHIENVFDGLLMWTGGGSGYLPQNGPFPNHSVGFWQPDSDLTRVLFGASARYSIHNALGNRSVKYVGYQESIATIQANTIVRVSLSRLYSPGTAPNGFYLQISGWY